MKFFYPLLCAFLVFFSACHEEEKLAALRKDVAALENSVDSLQKAKEKLQNVPNYTILSDTVREPNTRMLLSLCADTFLKVSIFCI